MAKKLSEIREDEVNRYAVARERLLKAVRDGLTGQVDQDELNGALGQEAESWERLVKTIDDACP